MAAIRRDRFGQPSFSIDFLLNARLGRIPGATGGISFGRNDDIGSSFETLWLEGGLRVQPTVGSAMTVSSTSVNDTLGGSGGALAFIQFLDSSFDSQVEVIELNGATPVTTTSTDIFRINAFAIISAGSSRTNEGIVYIGIGAVTAGKPAIVFSLIDINDSGDSVSSYTVAAGHRLIVLDNGFTSSAGKVVDTKFVVKTPDPNGVNFNTGIVTIDEGFSYARILGIPFVAEKNSFETQAKTTAGGTAACSLFLEFLLIEDAVFFDLT